MRFCDSRKGEFSGFVWTKYSFYLAPIRKINKNLNPVIRQRSWRFFTQPPSLSKSEYLQLKIRANSIASWILEVKNRVLAVAEMKKKNKTSYQRNIPLTSLSVHFTCCLFLHIIIEQTILLWKRKSLCIKILEILYTDTDELFFK